jgi:hypothetical protein
MPFDYTLDFETTDFREHPELYRIGKGEQGFCWLSHINRKFCRIGDFGRRTLPKNLRKSSSNCSALIETRGILSAWTWRGSFCKWDTPAPAATPITRAGANTRRIRSSSPIPTRKSKPEKPFCHRRRIGRTTKKPKARRFSMRFISRRRMIPFISQRTKSTRSSMDESSMFHPSSFILNKVPARSACRTNEKTPGRTKR